jgi:hypothetical protein
MNTCPACNAEFSEHSYTGLCLTCESVEPDPTAAKPMLAISALVLAVFPFFLSISSRSSGAYSDHRGSYAWSTGIDYVAVLGGALAVFLGVLSLPVYARLKHKRGMAIGLAGLLLGGYQFAYGMFWI